MPATARKLEPVIEVRTSELIDKIIAVCEAISGRKLYKYQLQFARRLVRSVLENDGEEITALFARQSGKSQTVADVSAALCVILPVLANMPMFASDVRLLGFKEGFWIGIFAPTLRQSQNTYNKIRKVLLGKHADPILSELGIKFESNNGITVSMNNGSFVTSSSASEGTNIEGDSYMLIICEECQDISDYKIRKCLTGDTRILLKSGKYTTIEKLVKLKKGKVVCFDKDMQRVTSKSPSEFYDNGIQPVYQLRLNNGDTIEATLNHQFYTYSKNTKKGGPKFRTVQEIKDSFDKYSSLRVGVPEILPYFSEEYLHDYERGQLIGYFLGDGCVVGTPKFIGDRVTCSKLHEIVKIFCGEVSMTEYAFNTENGMSEVCFSTEGNYKDSNTLVSFLKNFGIYNLTGADKKLPDKLYSKNFYKGLISSLIETDGCVESYATKPIISFANISEGLVRQLKDIYLKFGVHATLFSKDNTTGISENSKDLWLLHVKSVKDIKAFSDNITLFTKQNLLKQAVDTVANKETRNESYNYPESMRFYQVTEIKYVGKKHTYCLSVEGRNFIANNMISSNSIHPMGAAYNASIIKVGTCTTYRGDFYEAIQRNIKSYEEGKRSKNHYQYDYNTVMKYNPKYAKYIQKEIYRLGEDSDEFKLSYKLIWILERSMFVTSEYMSNSIYDKTLDVIHSCKSKRHVAGIDFGKSNDSTIITIGEPDWDNPIILEKATMFENRDVMSGRDEAYTAYKVILRNWLELVGDNYEDQYPQMMAFLANYRLEKVVADATGVGSPIVDRLAANLPCEVVPYVYNTPSKSALYKHFNAELRGKRLVVPACDTIQDTLIWRHFDRQITELQKSYTGSYMVCGHPNAKDAHDDYPDSCSLMLWAARRPGLMKVDCSENNPLLVKSRNVTSFYSARNSYTARRR